MARPSHLFTFLLAALVASVLAVPAVAEPEPDPCEDESGEIVYRDEEVFFHEGETKVGNLTQHGDQAPAPWDTEAPAGSVTGGNGAGSISGGGSLEGLVGGTAQRAHFAGGFDGCLDTLAIDLYHFSPTNRTGTSASGNEAPLNYEAELTIDGTTFLLAGPQEALTAANPGGNATYHSKIAITGIRGAMERRNMDLAASHEMTLTVTAWYVNTNNVVFVWDTTEVPAGMTFNGDLDGYGQAVPLF